MGQCCLLLLKAPLLLLQPPLIVARIRQEWNVKIRWFFLRLPFTCSGFPYYLHVPLLQKHLIYGDTVTFVVSLKHKSYLSFSFDFCSRHLISHHPAFTEPFGIKPNNLYRSMTQLVLEINKHLFMFWDMMPHRFLRVICLPRRSLWSCGIQTGNHKLVRVVSSRSSWEGPWWPSEQEEMFGIPGSSSSCQVVPGKLWISTFKQHRLEIYWQIQSSLTEIFACFFMIVS